MSCLECYTNSITPDAMGALACLADNKVAIRSAIAAAVSANLPLILNRNYATSETIVIPAGLTIVGNGMQTGFHGLNVAGPVLITYDGITSGYNGNINARDFNISGSATVALVVAHCNYSNFSNIGLNFFTGSEGFVFENAFANTYSSLSANQSTLRGTGSAAFKVNMVCLDSIWNLPYTSGAEDYNFIIDGNLQEYSHPTSGGFGGLIFNLPTSQGGQVNGFYIRSGRLITLNSPYFEACKNSLRIGDFSLGSTNPAADCVINNADFQGGLTSSNYACLLDNAANVKINNPALGIAAYAAIHLGNLVFGGAQISFPRIAGNGDFASCLKTTATASSPLQLSTDYVGVDGHRYQFWPGPASGLNLWNALINFTGAWQIETVSLGTYP